MHKGSMTNFLLLAYDSNTKFILNIFQTILPLPFLLWKIKILMDTMAAPVTQADLDNRLGHLREDIGIDIRKALKDALLPKHGGV